MGPLPAVIDSLPIRCLVQQLLEGSGKPAHEDRKLLDLVIVEVAERLVPHLEPIRSGNLVPAPARSGDANENGAPVIRVPSPLHQP